MYETVNHTKLYYEEYGTGDRIVIACGQHFDYDRKGWPFDLADEGFHVYVLTMRGYGKSDHILQDFQKNWYKIWADDVAAFADAKGIDRFFYTGQADGAGIGWHLCLEHPDRLIGFAGLAPGPHSRAEWHENDMRKQNRATISDPDAAERLAQYQRQRILHFAARYADNPELRKEFEEKAEKDYQWQLGKTREEKMIAPGITLPQFATDEELLDAMKNISFPVILFYGMKDAMLPYHSTALPIGAIPNCKAIFYQDGTNLIYYDRRDDIRTEIANFASQAFGL